MPLDGPRKKPVQAARPEGARGGQPPAGTWAVISLLRGRAGVGTAQLPEHHCWRRTRGARRAPTQARLSQHLLMGLAPWERDPGSRGARMCGGLLGGTV